MLGVLTSWSLIISSLYLFYLAAFSRMTIWHDSINYAYLGTLLSQGHWVQYLSEGLNREPFYPALIGLAMAISRKLTIDYTSVVMILQVLLLLATQALMVVMMCRLKVRDGVQAAVVLYTAFSPSLTNFTFVLWSDLIPASLILGGILMYVAGWKALMSKDMSWKEAAWRGCALAVILTLLTLLKAVFEVVSLFIILSFLAALPSVRADKFALRKWTIFVLTLLVCYQGAINTYKGLNWHFNGHYAVTNRGSWALYGNITKRMEPMTPQKWLAATLVIPHLDFCTMFLPQDPCHYWGTDTVSNGFGFAKLNELSQTMSESQADRVMVNASVQAMVKNPMQATALGFLEGCKLLFFEYYTPTAYAVYPSWVQHMYGFRPLMLVLRTLLSLLTVLAIGWTVLAIMRRRMWDERTMLLAAILVWVISYIIPYAFFYLFGRYALALAPVYLVLIAGMCEGFKKNAIPAR